MLRVFKISLCVVLCLFFAVLVGEDIAVLQSSVRAHNTQRILSLLKTCVGVRTSFSDVEQIAHEEGHSLLQRAVHVAINISNLEQNVGQSLGLEKGELLQIVFFIESSLKPLLEKKKYYLTAHETGLCRTLEFDPKSGYLFIHLETNKVDRIGKRNKKLVTKSILYDHKHPQLVARCDQLAVRSKEFSFLQKVKGTPGIIQALATTERICSGKKYRTFFCKHYRQGTLSKVLKDSAYTFTLKEKVHIAMSILKGLEGLHKLGIVHRDLNGDNYLVNITKKSDESRDIEVVICDLGFATFAKKAKGRRPQAISMYLPPEAFLHKMHWRDYFRTDCFAAALRLYQLFYEKLPEWWAIDYSKYRNAPKVRAKMLYDMIERVTQTRRAFLFAKAAKGERQSPSEEFESLILALVHPNPTKRPTVKEARKRLSALMLRSQH